MTALLNPKVWAAIALAAALTFSNFFVYRSGKAEVRKDFDAYKIAQQELRILADRAQRAEEQRRAAATAQEAQHAQARIASLEDSLRLARTASDGVRDAAAGAASRARARACSVAPSPGKSGEDPIGLLVDVLGRIDQRAGDLAEYADRLRIAGIACERTYDALTP
ncbi:DUF2514 family protein [Variovorax paradoxus]|uniref:DUF2514 family protein n=1 Tax=Variovorax paradoxus TaxID=34073 RepID=UPI0029C656BF|nr:DUF2514 family protein [Variovorax paradoxus]